MIPTEQPDRVGSLVAGRYHLVRLLGDGGMGAVYKAADQVLRRFVAIKLLHPETARKPASVRRFEREARAAAAIGHPNIIDIIDFGHERGRPFLVMEYLRGQSLSQVLTVDGPLAVKRAATIAVHTLAGLQAAHDRGVLHRDLKPANLMLVARFGEPNFVKVCDFGFAALLGGERPDDPSLTPVRTLVGTPAYAAPERLRGDDRRDPRIDVYSLGVVLYEMLAGRRPFDAPSFRELVRQVRKDPPAPLRRLRPDVPEDVERTVMAALAKDPDARWPSADAFAERLLPHSTVTRPFREELETDSFTVEMARIRAREARVRDEASPAEPAVELEALPTRRDPPRSGESPLARGDPASGPRPRGQSLASLRGRLVLAMLASVRESYGERALAELLAGMPAEARAPFEEGVDPDRWVDLTAVTTLLEHIDERFGEADLHMILETGRFTAGEVDPAPASATPELLVAELPSVLEGLVHGVSCEVRRVGRGYGRVELVEAGEPSLTFAVLALGLLERLLARGGADEVEVNLLSARALDDPQTLIDLSWFVG